MMALLKQQPKTTAALNNNKYFAQVVKTCRFRSSKNCAGTFHHVAFEFRQTVKGHSENIEALVSWLERLIVTPNKRSAAKISTVVAATCTVEIVVNDLRMKDSVGSVESRCGIGPDLILAEDRYLTERIWRRSCGGRAALTC